LFWFTFSASLDLGEETRTSQSYKSYDYPRVVRRHHYHNQYFKPYLKTRRSSLQPGLQREDHNFNLNLLKGLSLSDSGGSSGTGSGTGTPPPLLSSQEYRLCSKISSFCDKENALETHSNPNSPLRRNTGHFNNYSHYTSLPLKAQQFHAPPLSFRINEIHHLFRSKSLDDLNSLLEQDQSSTHQPIENFSSQQIFSSSCDIDNVLQKISRLKM